MTPAQQAPSVLLIGASGSGKTESLLTLIESGLELFVIVTEPRGVETLIDGCMRRKLPLEKLHWMEIFPTRKGFESLAQQARKVALMDQEALAKMKPGGERSNAQWIELYKGLLNFKDGKDGKEYGPVDDFDTSRVVAIDSLSGLSIMSMDITIGDKVTASPSEWGTAQNQIEKLLMTCSSMRCMFVLTAHAEREQDEITGVTRVMASALGRKLAPKLPRFFSEVVLSKRIAEGDNETFLWSTGEAGYELKKRSLPLSSKLPPSFGPIVEAYKARVQLIEQTRKAS